MGREEDGTGEQKNKRKNKMVIDEEEEKGKEKKRKEKKRKEKKRKEKKKDKKRKEKEEVKESEMEAVDGKEAKQATKNKVNYRRYLFRSSSFNSTNHLSGPGSTWRSK